MEEVMIIGVDIDGTITNETKGHDYTLRTPNKKMINKVNQWHREGHIIILFSSRWEADRETTKKWMKSNGVKYHTMILGKPVFDLYVDDISKRPEEVCK
jgi:uncharacterized HAD superfamily protein